METLAHRGGGGGVELHGDGVELVQRGADATGATRASKLVDPIVDSVGAGAGVRGSAADGDDFDKDARRPRRRKPSRHRHVAWHRRRSRDGNDRDAREPQCAAARRIRAGHVHSAVDGDATSEGRTSAKDRPRPRRCDQRVQMMAGHLLGRKRGPNCVHAGRQPEGLTRLGLPAEPGAVGRTGQLEHAMRRRRCNIHVEKSPKWRVLQQIQPKFCRGVTIVLETLRHAATFRSSASAGHRVAGPGGGDGYSPAAVEAIAARHREQRPCSVAAAVCRVNP